MARFLAILVLSLLLIPAAAKAADSPPSICATLTDDDKDRIAGAPKVVFSPVISIPGFLAGESKTVDSTTLGAYIRGVFIITVYVVAILAVVMIVFGGVKWVAAAGNPASISDAKDVITNAIIGLVIALTSYLILGTINPNFLQLPGVYAPEVLQCMYVPKNEAKGEHNEAVQCLTHNRKLPVQNEDVCALDEIRGFHSTLTWPVTGSGRKIASDYGPRPWVTVGHKCHAGLDFGTNGKVGVDILAAEKGTITRVGSYCNEQTVQITADKFVMQYVHLSSVMVKVGDVVNAGDVIAKSGGDPKVAKDCTTGAHLHFELYDKNGEIHDPKPCFIDTRDLGVPGY